MGKGLHLRIQEAAMERAKDTIGQKLRGKEEEDRECKIRRCRGGLRTTQLFLISHFQTCDNIGQGITA